MKCVEEFGNPSREDLAHFIDVAFGDAGGSRYFAAAVDGIKLWQSCRPCRFHRFADSLWRAFAVPAPGQPPEECDDKHSSLSLQWRARESRRALGPP